MNEEERNAALEFIHALVKRQDPQSPIDDLLEAFAAGTTFVHNSRPYCPGCQTCMDEWEENQKKQTPKRSKAKIK